MKVVSLFGFLGVLGFTALSATASPAQVPPKNSPIVREQTNERGFTLDDLLDGTLWVVARHPLSPAALSQVGNAVHQAPRRGIEFELLTPGDIGATIHFRW